MKDLIILAVIVIGLLFFMNQCQEEDAPVTTTTDQARYTNYIPPNVDDTDNETIDEEETKEENPPGSNACGYLNFDFPDYSGTSKAGDDCTDTFEDPNDECVNNPPTEYNGYINKATQESDPLLTCCVEDGTCQW